MRTVTFINVLFFSLIISAVFWSSTSSAAIKKKAPMYEDDYYNQYFQNPRAPRNNYFCPPGYEYISGMCRRARFPENNLHLEPHFNLAPRRPGQGQPPFRHPSGHFNPYADEYFF